MIPAASIQGALTDVILAEHGTQFGGLRHVPLKLTLWQTSNTLSEYKPFTVMQLDLQAPSLAAAMQVVTAGREAAKLAGLNDDVDAMLGEGDTEDAFLAAAADYGSSMDFYRQPAARRGGSDAIRSPQAALRAAVVPNVAAAAIADAVSMGASAAPALEAG